jgi:hypothetical protein
MTQHRCNGIGSPVYLSIGKVLLVLGHSGASWVCQDFTHRGEDVGSAFLPIEGRHRYGYTGVILLRRAGAEKDPLAIRVLATLGYSANDGPELLKR